MRFWEKMAKENSRNLVLAVTALLRDCLCGGLTSILYAESGFFACLVRILHRDLSAFLSAKVRVHAALFDILAGVFAALYSGTVGPLDRVLCAICSLDDKCLGALVDAFHDSAHDVCYVLRDRTL